MEVCGVGEVAGDGGGGEEGAEVLELGVAGGVFEEGFGGEMHAAEFILVYNVEAGAAEGGFAIFDFGEVNVVGFDGYEVDFVEVGFVILGDDLMTV